MLIVQIGLGKGRKARLGQCGYDLAAKRGRVKYRKRGDEKKKGGNKLECLVAINSNDLPWQNLFVLARVR